MSWALISIQNMHDSYFICIKIAVTLFEAILLIKEADWNPVITSPMAGKSSDIEKAAITISEVTYTNHQD